MGGTEDDALVRQQILLGHIGPSPSMIMLCLRRPQHVSKIPEGDSLWLSSEIEEGLYRPHRLSGRAPPRTNSRMTAGLGVRQYAGGTL